MTPLIVVACVGHFLARVIAGVSPLRPNVKSMLQWGAEFGPSLSIDHQFWRILSCTLLHFGLIHLALNLWHLIAAGPTFERFYGSLSFAALYLLFGLGGSIAILWWHPTIVSGEPLE